MGAAREDAIEVATEVVLQAASMVALKKALTAALMISSKVAAREALPEALPCALPDDLTGAVRRAVVYALYYALNVALPVAFKSAFRAALSSASENCHVPRRPQPDSSGAETRMQNCGHGKDYPQIPQITQIREPPRRTSAGRSQMSEARRQKSVAGKGRDVEGAGERVADAGLIPRAEAQEARPRNGAPRVVSCWLASDQSSVAGDGYGHRRGRQQSAVRNREAVVSVAGRSGWGQRDWQLVPWLPVSSFSLGRSSPCAVWDAESLRLGAA